MVDPEAYGHPSPSSQDGGGVCSGWAVVIRHGVVITEQEQHHQDTHGEEGAGRVQAIDKGPGRVREDNEDGGDQDAAQHILWEAEQRTVRALPVLISSQVKWI